jgi:AcrR family transcriptional regulator
MEQSTKRTRRAKPRLDREAKRERTRAELLKAARRVFGRRGYHEATLDEVVEESGLSKGALYYNFDSKANLFLALLEERIDERIGKLDGVVQAGPEGAGRSPGEIQAASVDFVRTLRQSREWRLLFLEFTAHAARDRRFQAEFAARAKRMRTALADLLRRAGYQGSLDPDTAAVVVAALANGLAIEALIDPDAVPDELFGTVLMGLMRGVARSGDEVRS